MKFLASCLLEYTRLAIRLVVDANLPRGVAGGLAFGIVT